MTPSFPLLLCGCLLTGAAPPLLADDFSPLEDWIHAQKHVRTLHITFRQERILKGLRKPLVSEGQLWIGRNERMRWQMGNPPRSIAIYNKQEALLIRPKKKQVEKRRIGDKNSRQNEVERAFLKTGLPDSRSDFEKFFNLVSSTREGNYQRLRMTVKDRTAGRALQWIELLIDTKRHQLAGYDIVFRDDSEIRTRFRTLKINPALDDSLFNPDLAGYKVGTMGE